ncbi:MAG: outer membrane protein assembly factor BamB [Cycloclasticus sp.]|nr:outer membrane protein assembly factor BamB [Cycloclasticus sp.]
MIRVVSIFFLTLSLTACSSFIETTKSASKSLESRVINMMSPGGNDGLEAAKPLEAISNEVVITKVWQKKPGKGQQENFLKLEMATSNGKLFMADDQGLVVALDQKTGDKIWEVKTNLPISGGIEVGAENLFFGTTDAEVVALKLSDGDTVWTSQVSSEVLSIPRYSDGFVIVRSIDGAISALDASDGKEVWSYVRDVPALSLRGTSSPVIKSGGVITGYANGKLVVLRLKDGLQIWETSVAVPRGRGALTRMVDVDADPLAGERFIYAATFNGGVVAVDVRSGEIAWRRTEMSSFKTMVADWLSVYVVDVKNHIWSADQNDGSINWEQDQLENRQLSPLAKTGDYLLTTDYEGYLHVLSASDGHLMSRLKVSDEAITAMPLIDGDLIYLQDVKGEITAIRLGVETAAEFKN